MTGATQKISGSRAAEGALHKHLSWHAPILLAVAAGLQITAVMSPMASQLGNLQPFIWGFAALIGFIQCFFIAELAVYFPNRSGGTATYAHEALGNRAGWLSALSSWAYWFAWTPGVAVNLILASNYLRGTVFPHASIVLISLTLGALLYILNFSGIHINVRVSTTLIVLTCIPLILILIATVAQPSLFSGTHIWPIRFPADQGSRAGLIIKWLFVAAWSAYGAEMSSTIFAEARATRNAIIHSMAIAGTACLIAFTVIPLVMTGIVGASALGNDPATVFLVPANAVLGAAGAKITGLMLAGALTVGAQAYIISSSRTLYQMSRDGYMPRFFLRVNRYGAPYGGIVCDATVIAVLVGIFGTNVVNVVAAANIGYMVVFVILPLVFVAIRRRSVYADAAVMPRWMTPIALLLATVNAVLLVVGGALWGTRIWLTGVIALAVVFPFMAVRSLEERRRRRQLASTGG